jgi:hypothetical protein
VQKAGAHWRIRQCCAACAVALGDETKTFELLRAAAQERSPRVAFLGLEPRFDGVRARPQFRDLLRAIGCNREV